MADKADQTRDEHAFVNSNDGISSCAFGLAETFARPAYGQVSSFSKALQAACLSTFMQKSCTSDTGSGDRSSPPKTGDATISITQA